jgi:hypothetical protein
MGYQMTGRAQVGVLSWRSPRWVIASAAGGNTGAFFDLRPRIAVVQTSKPTNVTPMR